MTALTLTEIYERLDAMTAALVERGYIPTNVEFELDDRPSVCLRYKVSADQSFVDADYKYFHADRGNEASALREAEEHIADLKSVHQAKREAFIGKLGRVIDEGHSLGLEVEFMNPLTETMKRLSENILEHRREDAR